MQIQAHPPGRKAPHDCPLPFIESHFLPWFAISKPLADRYAEETQFLHPTKLHVVSEPLHILFPKLRALLPFVFFSGVFYSPLRPLILHVTSSRKTSLPVCPAQDLPTLSFLKAPHQEMADSGMQQMFAEHIELPGRELQARLAGNVEIIHPETRTVFSHLCQSGFQ